MLIGADRRRGSLDDILAYTSAAIAVGWGIAHLVPTRKVVAGFGDLSEDNRLVLTMEWISEGMALVFVGLLVGVVAFVGETGDDLVLVVDALAAAMLVAMAILTAVTGARGSVVFFKICPFVKGLAAALLVGAMLV